jgi:nitrogen-specific signal transduction histidine kinase/FixJ family two-component response regulator
LKKKWSTPGRETFSVSLKKTEHTILFIEDNLDTRERVRAAFTKTDKPARLEFVSTPAAAFEVMGRETFDALFVNQVRSALSSSEFVRDLAAIDLQIPIIMMSPHPDEPAILHALRGGASECVGMDQATITSYPAIALRAIARSATFRAYAKRTLAIIRNQKQWMSVIDAITDHIYVLDDELRLVKVNNSFAMAIGMHPRDIVGKQLKDVFNGDIPSEALLNDVRRDGMPRTYEKKINDDIYQVSIFSLQENSRFLTIHVLKNITEVRRLKDQLYHADKLASIGLLVSGVAHEINNPLTGTIAYTELLAMKVTDEETRAELKKILDSAERCKKIVDNLMTFSRQRTPSKSLESINDIIDRAIGLRIYWLKANSIEIVRDYDPATTVYVDSQQIQQVVLNLLLNAEQAILDAGQVQGKIVFRTRTDKPRRRVIVTVIDNGPGIPPQIAAKIFDPFYSTKPVGEGTGLGLSISHGIITEHGGTIWFENNEGGGSTFTFELPTGTGLPAGQPINQGNQRTA